MSASTVSEIMTTPVLTVDPETPVADIAGAMRAEGINSIVVVSEDCQPEGLLTSTDFVAIVADEGTNPETTVGEWTATDVVTVEPATTVARAAALMREHDVGHLPVVDGEVKGIVTATDVTASLAADT